MTYSEAYLKHVAGQLAEFKLERDGVTQVVLASQDRRGGNGLSTNPLAVLVHEPTPHDPQLRVTDNGYLREALGLDELLTLKSSDLLDWHVVEVDDAGVLMAFVDDPTHVGQRIHDMEQAMNDVLRYAALRAVVDQSA